jgi:hypothetical protein
MNAGPKIAYGITIPSSENTPASAALGNARDQITPARAGGGGGKGVISVTRGRPGGLGKDGEPEKGGGGKDSEESVWGSEVTVASILGTRICGAPHCLQKGIPSSTIAPHL